MINALAHREYEAVDPVRVTVFSDRIEIVSPGPLAPGVDANAFRAGCVGPKWRNQTLAWFMSRMQLAQAEGQGIPTIIRTMREEGCPEPAFEPDSHKVVCLLPAHPRHALMRELQGIEGDIVLGNYQYARTRLDEILRVDPFNHRAVQLFCDVQKSVGDLRPVVQFALRHEGELGKFPPQAQIALGESISLDEQNTAGAARALARRLLQGAALGRYQESEVRRVAVGLLRVDEDSAALAFLDRQMAEHPNWSNNPALLQVRGRALIQLAKRCVQSGKNRALAGRIRARAWEDCRRYIAEAERDVRAALEHGPDATSRKMAESDLDYLQILKKTAQKPAGRASERAR